MDDQQGTQFGDVQYLGVSSPAITEKSPRTSHSSGISLPTEDPFEEWKAGRQEWLIIITLVLISLMASIDATILVPVLPVRNLSSKERTFEVWSDMSYRS